MATTAGAPGEFVELELEAALEPAETAEAVATAPPVREPSPDSIVESLPSSDFSDAVAQPAATPAIRETERAAPPRARVSPARETTRNVANAPRNLTKKISPNAASQRVGNSTATARLGAGGTGGTTGSAGRGPAYLNNPHPLYPPHAREAGQQGLVLLWVAINERGSVADLRLQRSSGFPELDAAAVGAVRGWRFRPATRGEVPVPAAIRVPVRFNLDR